MPFWVSSARLRSSKNSGWCVVTVVFHRSPFATTSTASMMVTAAREEGGLGLSSPLHMTREKERGSEGTREGVGLATM